MGRIRYGDKWYLLILCKHSTANFNERGAPNDSCQPS